MGDHLRISDRYWSTRRDVNISKDSHVLIGRHWIPIHPRPAKIIDLGRKDFHSECIHATRISGFTDIQFMNPESTRNLIGPGKTFTVQPNVCTEIDPIEVKPNFSPLIGCWKLKFSPVPPGVAKRTIVGHRSKRKVCADRVGAAWDLSKVHRKDRIRIDFFVD